MLVRPNLRRGRGKSRHPRLKHSPIKTKRILPDKNQINQLQNGELVEENAKNHGNDEHGQLRHDQTQLCNSQNFGTNNTTDSQRRDPHNAVNHFHDNLIDNVEKVNHHLAFFA